MSEKHDLKKLKAPLRVSNFDPAHKFIVNLPNGEKIEIEASEVQFESEGCLVFWGDRYNMSTGNTDSKVVFIAPPGSSAQWSGYLEEN